MNGGEDRRAAPQRGRGPRVGRWAGAALLVTASALAIGLLRDELSMAAGTGGARGTAAPVPEKPPAAVPGAALTWQPIGAGAARADTFTIEGGDGALQLFRFELSLFQPEVVVGAGRPPRRHTATELVSERGAVAAVNGGFFDERLRPLGLRITAGETRVPLRAKVDWGVLTFTSDGVARIMHTRDFAARAGVDSLPSAEKLRDALQVGPRLLVDGNPLKLKPQVARRTAVALDRAGRFLTLVVADVPLDANELAARLSALGFDSALMLDGGPSTQLALRLGPVEVNIPGGYAVPDLLAIYRRPAPAPGQPPPARRPAPATTPRP